MADREIEIIGLSYKTAPVEERESFSFSEKDYPRVLDAVFSTSSVEEAVVVSTCNRTEFISTANGSGSNKEHFVNIFKELSASKVEVLPELYMLKEQEAVSHIFRVAAGLDSMVLGEPQILGQLKTAYKTAHEKGSTKLLLNKLFHRAFAAGKAVRSRTKIGESAVSVCYAARELAGQIVGDLEGASIMLFGAGDTAELALKHFKSAGVKEVYIVNRTLERAVELADRFSAIPLSLENYREFISKVDVFIGATGLAQESSYLISADDILELCAKRSSQLQFLIDLGVPRNFNPDICELSDVFLYNIDDLEQVVARNLDGRAVEAERAEAILNEEVKRFFEWKEALRADPLIKSLQEQYGEISRAELDKTRKKLQQAKLEGAEVDLIEGLIKEHTEALIAKFLHQPISTLKSNDLKNKELIELYQEIFLNKKKPPVN